MSPNKKVVEDYMACFSRQDWTGMAALVTDDVERWEVGAPKPSHGKQEFDQEIRPGPDVSELRATVSRMFEEGDVVAAEGSVQVSLKDGKVIDVRYCDIFEFEDGKIKRLTAYTNVV